MTGPVPADESEVVLRCVTEAIDARERGLEPSLADICREHPHLVARVRAMLDLSRHLPGLARDAQGVDPLLGRRLAQRYRLDQRIGAGAMAVVYRGRDEDLGRPVAIKVLQTALFSGPEAEARFGREAEVLAALHHKSVVTVHDRGRTPDGLWFLVMELLEGAPLVRILLEADTRRRQRGDDAPDDTAWLRDLLGHEARLEGSWLRQTARWVAEMAAGAHAAHAAGIFHRDIKPSNVFIDRLGHAKLIDFGIAARSAQATLASSSDGALGTPAYMAPELLDQRTPARATLDVYGLAATLYTALTLRAPYLGTPSQVLSRLQHHDPTPAQRVRRGLPRDLVAILDAGMARRPADRYPDAARLERDLRAFLAHETVSVRPLGPMRRLWRRGRRSAAVQALMAAALLAAVGFGANAYREHAHTVRLRRHAAAWHALPPNLTLVQPANRVVHDPAERAALTELLDTAVAFADEPVPARLFRAAFRFDQGEGEGAAADLEAIADARGTEYARQLAARYRAAARASAPAVDLDGLPAPVDAVDRYLAAFHAVRARTSTTTTRVRELLEVEALVAWRPARELLAQELLFEATTLRAAADPGALERFQRLDDDVLRIESSLGGRSALTAHLLGGALVGQGRYVDALAPLRAGVAMSPWSHGLLITLGVVLRRVGSFDEAKAVLAAAIARRPRSPEPYRTLARVELDRGAFGAARACIAALPVSADADGARQLASDKALIEIGIAIALLAQGRDDEARAVAATAAALFAEAGRASVEQQVAEAIADGRDMADVWLAALLADPTSVDKLTNLRRTLPAVLDRPMVELLARYLERLARSLGPLRPPLPASPSGSPLPHSSGNPR